MLALGLAGAVAAARERRWRLVLLTAGPFLLTWYYLGALALIRARVDQHWHGGFSPPGRFLAASIPLLAVCVAMMLDRLRGRFAWSVTAALYAATLVRRSSFRSARTGDFTAVSGAPRRWSSSSRTRGSIPGDSFPPT